MKKYIILSLMVLIGFGVAMNSFADENRTIPYKHGVAKDADTVITANGGTLYLVTGDAEDANCGYSIHDASGRYGVGTTDVATIANTIVEGGEATDEDSLTTIDFGPEGIQFDNGLVVMTTTCNVSVLYR